MRLPANVTDTPIDKDETAFTLLPEQAKPSQAIKRRFFGFISCSLGELVVSRVRLVRRISVNRR
jgi:hypothetical protein